MRRFERIGLTSNQAEALTNHVTELICLNKEKISEQFVSKAALERVRLILAAALSQRGSACMSCQPAQLAHTEAGVCLSSSVLLLQDPVTQPCSTTLPGNQAGLRLAAW